MVKLINPEKNLKLNSELLTKAVVKLMKQDISARFKQTREITEEDWEFCEQIDWHPVDELPMKESFIKELQEAEKGPHSEPMSPDKLKRWFDEL